MKHTRITIIAGTVVAVALAAWGAAAMATTSKPAAVPSPRVRVYQSAGGLLRIETLRWRAPAGDSITMVTWSIRRGAARTPAPIATDHGRGTRPERILTVALGPFWGVITPAAPTMLPGDRVLPVEVPVPLGHPRPLSPPAPPVRRLSL